MDCSEDRHPTRRAFAGAAPAFMIVPRHVLGAPFVPPSDRITLASIGLGRQGQAVTMELLARPDVQVVAAAARDASVGAARCPRVDLRKLPR